MRYILAGLFLLGFCSPALAESVVPNFTRGTINATTESTTKVIETIRQVEYTTGESYTVTAGGAGTTATAQRSIELSVFK